MLKYLARRRDDDRGVTIVIMALSLVALCAIGGMAIDGGAAYANRRQSQNAADSAALAGTIILDDIRTGDQTDESKILAAVTTVALGAHHHGLHLSDRPVRLLRNELWVSVSLPDDQPRRWRFQHRRRGGREGQRHLGPPDLAGPRGRHRHGRRHRPPPRPRSKRRGASSAARHPSCCAGPTMSTRTTAF